MKAQARAASKREVVLDTETTGLDAEGADRLIEVGCVEIVDGMPTGRTLHHYVNPQRAVPAAVTKIHGITTEMLVDRPLFRAVAKEFLAFIGSDPLVAHNAAFDLRFVNAELLRAGLPQIAAARMVDTAQLAREKFPGSPVSLDALCRRFGVDNSHRERHGALLDAELLAQVYLELRGGRQRMLALADEAEAAAPLVQSAPVVRTPRPFPASPDELAQHEAFLKGIANPIWSQ